MPSLAIGASLPAIEYADSFGGIIPTFAISGTIAFLIQGNALTVLDISAPSAPTRIGHMPLVWGTNTLELLDISNPDLPALLATMTVSSVQAVMEAANRAYILTATQEPCGKFCVIVHNALAIMDISDPAAPQLLGRAQLFDNTSIVVGGITVMGGNAYIAWGDALRIVDVGNPATPIVRASYPTTAGVNTIQIVGDLAYLADQTG